MTDNWIFSDASRSALAARSLLDFSARASASASTIPIAILWVLLAFVLTMGARNRLSLFNKGILLWKLNVSARLARINASNARGWNPQPGVNPSNFRTLWPAFIREKEQHKLRSLVEITRAALAQLEFLKLPWLHLASGYSLQPEQGAVFAGGWAV